MVPAVGAGNIIHGIGRAFGAIITGVGKVYVMCRAANVILPAIGEIAKVGTILGGSYVMNHMLSDLHSNSATLCKETPESLSCTTADLCARGQMVLSAVLTGIIVTNLISIGKYTWNMLHRNERIPAATPDQITFRQRAENNMVRPTFYATNGQAFNTHASFRANPIEEWQQGDKIKVKRIWSLFGVDPLRFTNVTRGNEQVDGHRVQ